MVKEKHTLSINPKEWDLAKSSGVNVSELVEEAINLKCGSIKKVMEACSFCFKCKTKIKTDEVTRDFIPTDKNQLWIITKCKKCYDKIKINRIKNNIENPETEVTPTFFTEFMKDINDNAEALKLINVAEPGLVIVSSKDKFLDILKEG